MAGVKGKGGRPPKPAAARAREGGTARAGAVSHRPQPSTELVVVAGRNVPIEPPADMPEDARALWVEIVEALAAAGIVDRIDLPMLRLFCVQYARAWAAHQALDVGIPDDELEELDGRLAQMRAVRDAITARIAGMLNAGLTPEPKDVNAAATYERELSNLRVYRDARAKFGNMVALGSTGQLVEHPLLGAERASAALALRFAGQFGLTPSDRARLGLLALEGKKRDAELDDLIGAQPAR